MLRINIRLILFIFEFFRRGIKVKSSLPMLPVTIHPHVCSGSLISPVTDVSLMIEKRPAYKNRWKIYSTDLGEIFTGNTMLPSFLFISLLLQAIDTDGALTCLTNCVITGSKGQPLDISSRNCSTAIGHACLTIISYQYHSEQYIVMLSTSLSTNYDRFIYILPSNYLSYMTGYACSESDSCALEFTRTHLLDLFNRAYDSQKVSAELAPILEESRPLGTTLWCFDNETCTGGVCKIEYDTRLNLQKARGCQEKFDLPGVSVHDNNSYGSFLVECDRTRCNSPETLNKVKMILAKHNLTDTNGRIPADDIGKHSTTPGKLTVTSTSDQNTTPRNPNHGHNVMVSILLPYGVALSSILVNVLPI